MSTSMKRPWCAFQNDAAVVITRHYGVERTDALETVNFLLLRSFSWRRVIDGVGRPFAALIVGVRRRQPRSGGVHGIGRRREEILLRRRRRSYLDLNASVTSC